MKTHTIKTPTAELLIIEPPNSWGLVIGEEALLIYDHTKKVFGKTHTFDGSYTLLGKPDEIREEDAAQLIPMYFDYEKTAVEYLVEMIESEIYWDVNPIKIHTWASENADLYLKQWHEAEQKTFNRNRSVIFNKVTPKI